MNIPDFMPRLRRGEGRTPQDGGCLVQVAGYLYDGHSWTDKTPCVHPILRHIAICVNDIVSERARQGLLEFAPRLIGTGDDSPRITDELVEWCMKQARDAMSPGRAYAYAAHSDAPGAQRVEAIVGLTLRDVHDSATRSSWRLPLGVDGALTSFLGGAIDAYDRITDRKVSGKTVSDEDWKRIREHMRAAA